MERKWWQVNEKGEKKKDGNGERKKWEVNENGGREKKVWCGLKINMDEIQFKSFLQLMN